MKKIKYTITSLLFGFMFFGFQTTINLKAQTITPQELLKSKKWNIDSFDKNIYYQFTNHEEITFVNGISATIQKYYISESNNYGKPFDESKIGLTSSGNFLVTKRHSSLITVKDSKTIILTTYIRDYPFRTTTTLTAVE